MGLVSTLFGLIGNIVGWILAGIWTWNWIQPDSFGRAVLWLIVFAIASLIVRLICMGIGVVIGSIFD